MHNLFSIGLSVVGAVGRRGKGRLIAESQEGDKCIHDSRETPVSDSVSLKNTHNRERIFSNIDDFDFKSNIIFFIEAHEESLGILRILLDNRFFHTKLCRNIANCVVNVPHFGQYIQCVQEKIRFQYK